MNYLTFDGGLPSSVRPGRSNTVNPNLSQSQRSRSAGSSKSAARYGMVNMADLPPPVPQYGRELASRSGRGPASDSGGVYRSQTSASRPSRPQNTEYNYYASNTRPTAPPSTSSRSSSRDPGQRYGRQDLRDTVSESGGDATRSPYRSASQHHLRQTKSRPESPELRSVRPSPSSNFAVSPRPAVHRSRSQVRQDSRENQVTPMFYKDPNTRSPPKPQQTRSGSPESQRSSSGSSADSLFDQRSGTSSRATSIRSDRSKDSSSKLPNNAWATSANGYYDAARGLWDSVTTKLSDVSKTWRVEDENAVPPLGQDSHLSLVMKRFYLERVERAEDLPDWLFTDRERGVGDGSQDFVIKDLDAEREARQKQKREEESRGRGEYLSSTQRQERAWRERRKFHYDDDPSPSLTRAATKLRAMTDAKRGGHRYI